MDYFLAFGKNTDHNYDLQYNKSILTLKGGISINESYPENHLKVSDSVPVLHHVDLELTKTYIN